MLKATKLTLAALFVAGSCGLAVAQTGNADSGGVANDKPANRDTIGTSKQQANEVKGRGDAVPRPLRAQERRAWSWPCAWPCE